MLGEGQRGGSAERRALLPALAPAGAAKGCAASLPGATPEPLRSGRCPLRGARRLWDPLGPRWELPGSPGSRRLGKDGALRGADRGGRRLALGVGTRAPGPACGCRAPPEPALRQRPALHGAAGLLAVPMGLLAVPMLLFLSFFFFFSSLSLKAKQTKPPPSSRRNFPRSLQPAQRAAAGRGRASPTPMAAEPRAAAGQPLPRPAALPAPPGPISGPIPAAAAPLSLRRGAPGRRLPAAPVAAAPAWSWGRRGQAPALTGRSRHFRQRRRPPPHDGLGAGRERVGAGRVPCLAEGAPRGSRGCLGLGPVSSGCRRPRAPSLSRPPARPAARHAAVPWR